VLVKRAMILCGADCDAPNVFVGAVPVIGRCTIQPTSEQVRYTALELPKRIQLVNLAVATGTDAAGVDCHASVIGRNCN
jgi:hypothetical protein